MTADHAFGVAIADERQFLKNFAIRRLGRKPYDADDLVQDVMLRAWAACASFISSPKQNLRAWLIRIMQNRRFSQHRHEKIVAFISLESDYVGENYEARPSARISDAITVSGGQEEMARLRDALREMSKLPPAQCAALLMAANGLSMERTARDMGIAIGTAKSRISRARQAVRAAS